MYRSVPAPEQPAQAKAKSAAKNSQLGRATMDPRMPQFALEVQIDHFSAVHRAQGTPNLQLNAVRNEVHRPISEKNVDSARMIARRRHLHGHVRHGPRETLARAGERVRR